MGDSVIERGSSRPDAKFSSKAKSTEARAGNEYGRLSRLMELSLGANLSSRATGNLPLVSSRGGKEVLERNARHYRVVMDGPR